MTTWVLLRGLMREARHWGEFPAQFQAAIGAAQLVTLDFPGNGNLHAQASMRSVEEMADHCRHQLSQRGYRPPYRVLALSLGAMVAVDWSQRYPDEIDNMVLINTSLAPYNPFYQRLRPSNYPALITALLHGSTAQRESLILRLTSKQSATAQAPALLQQWVGYAHACPISRANILRQLLAAIRYRAARHPPPMPVLLLAGAQDQLVNPQCSLNIAQKWGCALALHPTAGHDLPLDDGAWVALKITEFCQP